MRDIRQLSTSQNFMVFPQSVGFMMCVGGAVTAASGAVGIWVGWQGDQWMMPVLTGWLLPLGLWMIGAYLTDPGARNPDATLMLSPEGVHFLIEATGVVPWTELHSIGGYLVKGNPGLIINVEEEAMERLSHSEFFRKSHRLDATYGTNGLLIYQQQSKLPLVDLAALLHRYSIAHGGPALQPDP